MYQGVGLAHWVASLMRSQDTVSVARMMEDSHQRIFSLTTVKRDNKSTAVRPTTSALFTALHREEK